MSIDAVPTGHESPTAAASGRPRVLVIGGKLKLVRKARELGLDVVHAQYPDAYDRGHWPYVDQALLLDYGDIDRLLPLARALHAAYPFQAAVSLFELGLLPAARINEALGLRGESVDTVELLLDKWRMRQQLAAKGISPMASAVGRSAQDVRDFVDRHGLPIIVKPVRESGSVGVFRVTDEAEVDTVAERYRSLDDQEWVVGDLFAADSFDEFLMEEYLDGPEVSVETLSFDGRHVIVAVTDKAEFGGGSGFVELGLSQPSRHPEETLREVRQLVTDFLDAMGLRNGPSHTEIRLTSRGPRVIESHNRIGGYGVNEMVETAYGVDMELHTLGTPLGLVEPLTASPEPRGGVALQALTPEPGRVVEVTGVDAVRADPAFVDLHVKLRPGDVVAPLTWNEDIGGYVIARGADATEAIAHSKRLAEAIHVRTEPVR
ncbi:ATP-grasp domain-containing protein [Streptomyces ficellus]|uniref:ATP-grasp domain-containing protein n=1 Tax=Streptomyces ficellus TaxID=1977088 RepID=A0A1W5T2G0_9ACTN|nr:ATP-grasp domain-containing protein [Streptomyces ficellus]ARF06206.1 carboxylase [Streptomyces ficellus]QGV77860.1 ATP-grasp domain-containing protein [Streptomyces ficellus]